MRRRAAAAGFTIVELLVSIALIGLLVALLLPAIQQARETGRRARCQNNLKQQALAALELEAATGRLPTGGWGGKWVGDPDRGSGKRQPGGWIYCVLPYLEQLDIRQFGHSASPSELKAALAYVIQLPIPIFNCPTRRPAIAYPIARAYATTPLQSNPVYTAGRSDYAANAGDQSRCEIYSWWKPNSLAQGDDPTLAWPDVSDHTGISFLRSEIELAQITDGTAFTYLIGEKQLNSAEYDVGTNHGDDWSMYTGYQDDIFRCANQLPATDFIPLSDTCRFGSAHPDGWNAAFCDGHVRWISFEIALVIHRRLANRADGMAVDDASF